jgi:FkbM family methyltransferase
VPESFSQFGEDRLVWRHFGARPHGYFVEIGANHPRHYSQTWLLESRGWEGLLVEPLGAKCALLRRERPRSRVVQAALGAPEQRGRVRFHVAADDDMLSSLAPEPGVDTAATEEVELRTLDDVLAEAGRPAIDFLSIDVEGHELSVLRGFDLARHRPRLILIEDHLHHLRVHRHLQHGGYRLVKRTGCNNWYVPVGEPFALSGFFERLALWKEIHLDTPLRGWRLARRGRHASPGAES